MTPPYRLTKGAAADLRGIVRYTVEQWGKEQCRTYVTQIEKTARALAEGEGQFKSLDEVHPGLRMKLAGHHYIFCLPQPDRLASTLWPSCMSGWISWSASRSGCDSRKTDRRPAFDGDWCCSHHLLQI